MLFEKIKSEIENLDFSSIPAERKTLLQEFAGYIRYKKANQKAINLNFICTHNSRRSHLSQVWAQVMAAHYKVPNVYGYSGGTEATAMFPVVGEILVSQGFDLLKLSESSNPVYALKYGENLAPIICFSKKYDDAFNPKSDFAAIMTCSNADQGCPLVLGAEARFPIKFEDPKASDNTPHQKQTYLERSRQIATEIGYAFSLV